MLRAIVSCCFIDRRTRSPMDAFETMALVSLSWEHGEGTFFLPFQRKIAAKHSEDYLEFYLRTKEVIYEELFFIYSALCLSFYL